MKNDYKIINNTVEVKVISKTYGEYKVLIDLEDLPRFENKKINVKMTGKKQMKPYFRITHEGRQIALHSFIIDYYGELEIDHINRKTWDNRKENLRVVTHSDNMLNKDITSNNTTGVKGVTKRKGKWIARLFKNGEYVFTGSYDTLEEASQARKNAEKKYLK